MRIALFLLLIVFGGCATIQPIKTTVSVQYHDEYTTVQLNTEGEIKF